MSKLDTQIGGSMAVFREFKGSSLVDEVSDYVAIDIETTGLDPEWCEIIEIAALRIQNDVVVDHFQTLVKPEEAIPQFIEELTGITNDMVIDAPGINKATANFADFVGNSILIGHNVNFDINFLYDNLLLQHDYHLSNDFIDTMRVARRFLPDLDHHRLKDLVSYFNIDSSEFHRALADCESTYYIYSALKQYAIEHNCEWGIKRKWTNNSHRNACSCTTTALNELSNLLMSVTEDGVLTPQEIQDVSDWLDSHFELSGNYPFDRVFSALHTALADGVLEQSEIDSLLSLFQTVTDPISQIDECKESICIHGKTVCLTGDFESMSRSQAEKKMQEYGAIVKKSVIKSLDYLIVGGQGSSMWSAGNYGNKVKKALENQSKGLHVQIIREADFFAALSKNESKPETANL